MNTPIKTNAMRNATDLNQTRIEKIEALDLLIEAKKVKLEQIRLQTATIGDQTNTIDLALSRNEKKQALIRTLEFSFVLVTTLLVVFELIIG